MTETCVRFEGERRNWTTHKWEILCPNSEMCRDFFPFGWFLRYKLSGVAGHFFGAFSIRTEPVVRQDANLMDLDCIIRGCRVAEKASCTSGISGQRIALFAMLAFISSSFFAFRFPASGLDFFLRFAYYTLSEMHTLIRKLPAEMVIWAMVGTRHARCNIWRIFR
jgi:hypothetical protein